jgi:hypothetical protein
MVPSKINFDIYRDKTASVNKYCSLRHFKFFGLIVLLVCSYGSLGM